MDVSGVDGFAASVSSAADDLRNLEHANTAAGRLIAGAADSRVPRVTGHLANSQVVDVSADGVSVGYRAPYAHVIDRKTGFLSGTVPDLLTQLDSLFTREVATIVGTVHD